MGQGKSNKKNRNENQEPEKKDSEARRLEEEIEEKEDSRLEEYGQIILEDNRKQREIHLITIIDEVEGHENSSGSSKTIKYDHILPRLAEIENNDSVDGLLVFLNTSGGDVNAGLAIVEVIASLSLSTVSLVLGGDHSIDVSLAVSANYSFVMPSGAMTIHPVRVTDIVIRTAQAYEYFGVIQDRILIFVASHADIAYGQFRDLMHNTEMLIRDLDTVPVEEQAVDAGLINRVGGIKGALEKLYEMIDERKRRR